MRDERGVGVAGGQCVVISGIFKESGHLHIFLYSDKARACRRADGEEKVRVHCKISIWDSREASKWPTPRSFTFVELIPHPMILIISRRFS